MAILSPEVIKIIQQQAITEAVNHQFNHDGARWSRFAGLNGAKVYLRRTADEELKHQFKFEHYLDGLGVPPPKVWDSLQEYFTEAMQHERDTTVALEQLSVAATEEGDTMTAEFVDQYLREGRKSITEIENILNWFARGFDLERIDHKLKGLA